jgi:pimeloyl-ACP methyl ester carboxylesterase
MDRRGDRPSLLLVHGAANGAWVWDAWRRQLRALGWDANVLDLQGHGRSLPVDLSTVTMEDYAADLGSVAAQIAASKGRPPVVGGWSMGGLVAMMHAAQHPETPALLLFSPSPPLEVAGRGDPDEVRRTPAGVFGPEVYGVYPDDPAASRETMRDLTDDEIERVLQNSAGAVESGMARRQRKRGVSVPAGSVSCPSLVVYGDADQSFSPEANRRLALYLGGESLAVPGAGHWGIVYNESAVEATAPMLDAWLQRVLN